MNVSDYTYLMNKPDAITEKQADALGSVLNEFPYFQSARALRLKGLYNQNSFKYNYALKVAAAYTADRSVLFDFITSEAFTSIQNDFYEQKLRDLLEITVFDSEIISPEQIQKAIEVKTDIEVQPILDTIKEAPIPVIETPSTVQSVKVEESVKTEELVQAEEIKAQEPVIIEEPKKLPEIDPSIFLAIKEAQTITFEKPVTEEEKLQPLPEIDLSIFTAIKQAQNVTFEKQVIEEEKPKPLQEIDLSTFTAIKEAQNVTFEKPVIEEEQKTDSIESNISDVTEEEIASLTESTQTEETKIDRIENSILNSIKVSETPATPEPVKTEEQKEEPKNERIENSILSSIKESEAKTAEQSVKTEEPVIEEPTQNLVEEDEDDSVIEEMIIPEFKMNTVERSILSSIKEAETKAPAEPKEEIREVIKSEDKEEEEEIKEENEEPIEEIIEEEETDEPAKTAAEHLEIGKPLDFSLSEKHSFQEWLQLSRTEPIDRSNELSPEEKAEKEAAEKIKLEEERLKKAEIIDKFIENNPKISPIKAGNNTPPVQIESGSEDNSYLMTETLARVYLEQKKYTKAIQAYEILILKYPEKITFFADRISDIKILQQNNNNNN